MAVSITAVLTEDYPTLVGVWSSSVLATHDFLSATDYDDIKQQLIPAYFSAVTLYKAVDGQTQKTVGFVGVLDGCVEMLFVDAKARGLGVGTALLEYAVRHLAATRVDVNEQNPQAVGFYLHYGFQQVGRSALDAAGKPYPILHLALAG